MKYQILYKWAIQKTRVAKELEGAARLRAYERKRPIKKTNKRASERAEGII
jgi:hypothetical protein